ncbi:MAG TPA: hypothetical protein VHI52_08405, partial [Verrucomicrobiae bacterium]|nr:hypothetical protein [Verrucomicrobiae bacterium]
QLMDDIQDLPEDRAKAHRTIMAEQIAVGPLDDMASRLWCLAGGLLRERGLSGMGSESILCLIQENCKRILFHAVALRPDFYTEKFVAMLESHCPFSFAYLRELSAFLMKERTRILSTRRVCSIFDLID